MRAAGDKRARGKFLALACAASAASLLAVARPPEAHPAEVMSERLRSANASLAAESHAVLLELYALESRLARSEARAAALRARAQAVARREEAARSRLGLVRRTLAEAQRRLAGRLRDLYFQGEADPLAVLLGAESLGEAVATLENLGHFARQDRVVIRQVRRARTELRAAVRDLAARRDELASLTEQADAASASLRRGHAARESYLARLLRERRLNEAQLARLEVRAESAEEKADEIQSDDTAPIPTPTPAPSPAPPAASPAAGPGTTMTVEATGYSLPGTTATGVPVGWGIVAVDPSVIPLGTRMTIPGYGEGVAADTGSAVKGAIIDLWFPTTAQALAWGRRTVTITLH